MPGTSRCEMVVLLGSPNSRSRANVSSRPASISVGDITSSSALCGKACHVMCPALMAARTVAVAVAFGQRTPSPTGQSRNRFSTHDWNMKPSLSSP